MTLIVCFCCVISIDSEFADIFDLEHFKRTLADDVRIVSSLPSTHLMTRPVEEKKTPMHVDAQWIRSIYSKRVCSYHCTHFATKF